MKKDHAPTLRAIAAKDGRDYTTPEDISDAFKMAEDREKIVLEVLAVLGRITDIGAEDRGLCAFTAWDEFRKKNRPTRKAKR